VFPFGRWNREPTHRGEIVNDGPACWFTCTCGELGPVRDHLSAADTDAVAHEREVFTRRRAGLRFVRGRWEPA
jgi:hypothetical protein